MVFGVDTSVSGVLIYRFFLLSSDEDEFTVSGVRGLRSLLSMSLVCKGVNWLLKFSEYLGRLLVVSPDDRLRDDRDVFLGGLPELFSMSLVCNSVNWLLWFSVCLGRLVVVSPDDRPREDRDVFLGGLLGIG